MPHIELLDPAVDRDQINEIVWYRPSSAEVHLQLVRVTEILTGHLASHDLYMRTLRVAF